MQQKLLVPDSTRLLLNAIAKDQPMQLLGAVRKYYSRGVIDFEKVLSIDAFARVPNLTHVYGFEMIHKLVAVLLTQFNNSMNLIRPLTGEQVVEISEALVMTAEEDQLSMEDLVLFFKGAREGKYGKIYDRLDQQMVFQILEEYRQQRHEAYRRSEEARHLQFKGIGETERTNEPDMISEHLSKLGNRIAVLKDNLKEQREINRMNQYSKDL